MMAATRVIILCLLIVQWGTLAVLAYPTGAPLCDFGANSLAIIKGGMLGPDTGGGLAANSKITWTMSATTAKAGHSVTLNFTNADALLLGFLIYAQHSDGNRYGVFDLVNSQPPGYAIYVNATMVPGGCPGGNGPTITQSNNNCDFANYLFIYKSDINHPGAITFNVFMMVDGNILPDARGNWFILNSQTVTFTAPAGTTGSATTGYYAGAPTVAPPVTPPGAPSATPVVQPSAAAAKAPAAAALAPNAIAGIIVGVILAVILIAVFLFPIIFAATHKDDPRVQRLTQRMTNTFKR